MSTRCNIVLTESYSWKDEKTGKEKNRTEKLFFYRHSDGYPEGALPTLLKFVHAIKSGKIRNNLSQCAGWLVLYGAIEYDTMKDAFEGKYKPDLLEHLYGWKVGAYEPTTTLHCDINYKYEIDVNKATIKCFKRTGSWQKLLFEEVDISSHIKGFELDIEVERDQSKINPKHN